MNNHVDRNPGAPEHTDGKLILGCFIHAGTWNVLLDRIHTWSVARESRYVCICNVHSVVTARQNRLFRRALFHADMATPDGMPLAWMLRQMGYPAQQRINGPDLMWQYCARAALSSESIFLYGGTQATLDALAQKLRAAFPEITIAGCYSPPFRALSAGEDMQITEQINRSGANIVFVSLGCPKQELWMAEHRGKIHAVMVGVGAAFDYHAGTLQRAPRFMQEHGLEWLHRLYSEPRRLWKRYMVTNSIFIIAASWQLIVHKLKNPFNP